MTLTAQGKEFITIVIVLSILSTAFSTTRLAVRHKGALGTDDYVLSIALLFLWAQAAGACLLASRGGMGRPIATLSPDEVTWLFKMFYWPELGYTILVVLVKTSILLSYRRIFGHMTKVLIHIYVLLGLTWSWGISIFFVCVFQCTPIDKAWEPLKPGKCIDLLPFLWGNSISNFIIDWMILAVPIVPVWKLQMNPAQKTLVAGSFALGSVACIGSTIRGVSTGSIDINDLSKSVFKASIWTYIEPSVAIISACLPFLSRILGQKIIGALAYVSTVGSAARSMFRWRTAANSTDGTHAQSVPRKHHAITKHTVITVGRTSRGEGSNPYELSNYPASHVVPRWVENESARSLV